MNKDIHIGTSGWHYKHWEGVFYPEDINSKDYFEFYSIQFRTVEINNTFYQLPEKHEFRKWRKEAPKNFLFAVKANRYITHFKKLKDPKEPLNNFISHAKLLKSSLGPILFQLPPHWHKDPERLENFLNILPKDYKYAFEFRDKSWFDKDIKELLKKYSVGFCIYLMAGYSSPEWITSNLIYIRFHGSTGSYSGGYHGNTLRA